MNFGKLQLVLLMGVLLTYLARSVAEEQKCRDKKDIIIVLDESSSIEPDAYKHMKESVAELVTYFKVAKDFVRFSVLGFSTHVNKENEIKFASYKDVSDLKKQILNMKQKRGGTNLGRAIGYINDKVMPYTRQHSSVVVWVLTDGEAKDLPVLKNERKRLGKDVTIEVLGISNGDKKLEKYYDDRLKEYVNRVVVIESMKDFRDDVIQNLKERLCPKTPKEPKEERKCQDKKDIIVVLDESSSIEPDAYKHMKNSVAKLVGYFNVAKNYVRFSVLGFSTHVNKKNVIKFGSYKNVFELEKQILSMEQKRGGTNLGRAIGYVNDEIMPYTRKHSVVVWILTDGEAKDIPVLKEERERLGDDVTVEVLGISNGDAELEKYYDERLKEYVDGVVVIKSMEDFRDNVIKDLKERLCP